MTQIQQYGNVLVAGTFNATSTAGLVTTRALTLITAQLPAAQFTPVTGALNGRIWGFCITNNDAAADLYISYSFNGTSTNLPTTTNFYRKIAAGTSFEPTPGAAGGVLNKLQILSSVASSAAQLTIFG